MKRETLQRIFRFLIRALTRTEVVGVEHMPPTGGVLLATNHMSRADAPLLLVLSGRDDVTAMVTTKYQRYPFFKWILDIAQVVWLEREGADFAAIRAGVDALRRGVVLGIAPEGTRSKDAQLLPGKPGVALLAERARVPVVPVAILGSEHAIKGIFTLRRPRIKMMYGKPFVLEPFDRDDREGWLQRSTDEIMCRIAAMMPPSYWGYYRDHPRLKELLAEQAATPA